MAAGFPCLGQPIGDLPVQGGVHVAHAHPVAAEQHAPPQGRNRMPTRIDWMMPASNQLAPRMMPVAAAELVILGWPEVTYKPPVQVIDADGTNLRTVAVGTHASWSPDGARIATLDTYRRVGGPISVDRCGRRL